MKVQNLINRALYKDEIIIFMPVIESFKYQQ